MPYVNIKVAKNGITEKKKEQLIWEVTKLLSAIMEKDPNTVVVVIDEVSADNWGVGGESLTKRKKTNKN